MRLTTKGRFAVTAMIDLALRSGEGPVTLAGISERQKISLSYLEQLFGKLRRHGLVDSVRGPGGGYCLARPGNQITVTDIVRAVDEPLDATQWPTLKAIRVALLLRSKKLERANEWDAPRPQWFGTDFDDDTLNPADGTAWQQYRYEVFEREIPLKNLIWGGQAQ